MKKEKIDCLYVKNIELGAKEKLMSEKNKSKKKDFHNFFVNFKLFNSVDNKQKKYPPMNSNKNNRRKFSTKRLNDNHNFTMTGKNLT